MQHAVASLFFQPQTAKQAGKVWQPLEEKHCAFF